MRKWVLGYLAMAGGMIAALMLVIWAVGGFDDMGLSADGTYALILTVVLTVVSSLSLMGLVFYSARRGHDATVMDGESTSLRGWNQTER